MRRSEGGSVGAEVGRGEVLLAVAGVPASRGEAMALWAAVSGGTPGDVWLGWERPAPAGLARRFRRAVAQRAAGAPAAYAAGRAGFRRLELAVDAAVLIPRPETEGLVQLVLDWAGARWGRRPWGRALDLGTGSGAIALALADEGRFGELVASDVSTRALRVARANARLVAGGSRIAFRCGAFFEPVGGEVFDVIVSNPPYVTAAEHRRLEPAVRDHEPREALVSGEGGLGHTHAILRSAARHLRPGGLLALEIDCRRTDETTALATRLGWVTTVRRDLYGRLRYLLAHREELA